MSKYIHGHCERQGFSEGGRKEKIKTDFQFAIEAGIFQLLSLHALDTLSHIIWLGIGATPPILEESL